MTDGRTAEHATAAVRVLLMGRAWGFLSGPVTLVFLGSKLSPSEQGYWYAMASLLALTAFFELGLGQALTIHAAHAGEPLRRGPEGYDGPDSARDRVGQFLRMACGWGTGAAVTFAIAVWIVGRHMFATDPASAQVHWHLPWAFAVIVASVQLLLGPPLAVFEGLGDNVLIARTRLLLGVIASVGIWAALSFGAGLLAAVWAPLIQVLGGLAILLGWRRREFFDLIRRKDLGFSWSSDFLPLQWRFAVSWLSGYVIFQLATPLIFKRLDAVDAGRMGMSMALVWAIIGVGTAWSNAAAPRFGVLAAADEDDEMDRLLGRCLRRGLLLAGLSAGAVILATAGAKAWGWDIADRVLGVGPLGMLLATGLVHAAISTIAVRLRAHRQEPLLWVSIVEAFVMVLALVGCTQVWGLHGAVTAFVVVHGLLTLGAVLLVYHRFRRARRRLTAAGAPC